LDIWSPHAAKSIADKIETVMKNLFIVFCINFYIAKITALAVTIVTKISGKSTKIEG
jgi:hypothetical protein